MDLFSAAASLMGYKILGTAMPDPDTLTDLYEVPASTETRLTALFISNHALETDNARLAFAPAGATDDPSHYAHYDVPIPGRDSLLITGDLPLATTDVVRVYSLNGNLSFVALGEEKAVA